MEILNLTAKEINQNGYHKTVLTREKIGALYTFPIDFTPEDCLACDGYSLEIVDYKELYKVIGDKFKKNDDLAGTFRIPDYNVSKRFLQPTQNAGSQINAGLPNITGTLGVIGLSGATYTGAFYYVGRGAALSNSGEGDYIAGFDASLSNSIYGKSATVQPPAQGVHVCIKYK